MAHYGRDHPLDGRGSGPDRLRTALCCADLMRTSSISKARILEAVTEACSKGAAENLAKLKKDALAARAEGKLAGTGWLPAVLRSAAWDDAAIATTETAEAA